MPRLGLRAFIGHLLIGWEPSTSSIRLVFHLLLEAHHIRMVKNYQLYDWGYTLRCSLPPARTLVPSREPSSATG